MACCGSCGQARLGETDQDAFLHTRHAIAVFNAGSRRVSCPRYSPPYTVTSRNGAASKTSKASSTAPTFRRKKGGLCRPVPGREGHKGHGACRPPWSSALYPSCSRKPTRQGAHRRNSRRCFRGRAATSMDCRQGVGCAERAKALGRRTGHRTHRAQTRRKTTKYPQTRRTVTAPNQASMERRAAVRLAQALEASRNSMG